MSFKVRLLLGAAAPLVFVLPAAAQTTISTSTTTPVNTSTVNSGAPADLIIGSAGSINPTAGTANVTAVTVDSNNTFNNQGSILLNNSDNSIGVRINPNVTSTFTNTGSISLVEDYDRTDTDADGDLDGPLATGTGRYGVLFSPGGTFTGNINHTSGSIAIEGNNSAGFSIQSAVAGNYTLDGSIALVGSNGFGLDIQKNISGNVLLSGSISAQGEGSRGVRVLGDIGGEFMNDGGVIATGFTSTTVSNYADASQLLSTDVPIAKRRDPDDLLVGGSAMQISGNLAFGFLNNGVAIGTTVDTTPDVKDVIQNFNVNRGTGAITSFGSAPAVDIAPLSGAAGHNVTFGKVRESVRDTLDDDADSNLEEIIGTFNYDYGLMNRGTILGNGLNIGFSATGLRIAGSADGAYTTTIAGGMYNSGQISAQAYEANAIGLDIGAGATVPTLVNAGQIAATTLTETNNSAIGVLVRQGANLGSVTTGGSITGTVRGYGGDAIAFRDLSGSIASFTNTSRVVAGHVDDDTTDTITSGTGRNIALDFAANTTGVTLTQTDVVDNARIFGEVLFGSGADRFNLLSGQSIGNVDFGATGNDTLNINSALLSGNAVFHGAGANVTMSNGGLMVGALTFGSAAANLSLSGNSIYDGAITSTGSVGINLNNATLTQRASTALPVSTLTVANNSRIYVDVNDARIAGAAPVFNVAGAASLAADTKIAPTFSNVQLNPFSIRLIQAGSLTTGAAVSSMLDTTFTPYLYQLGLTQTGANVDLTARVKTVDELGLGNFQRDSYGAVLNLLRSENTVGSAITQLTDAASFARAYNDLLPPNDTSIMKVLATNASAAMGATGRRLDLVSDKPNAPGGAWLEEFGLFHNADATKDSLKTSGGGFGVAGGFDLISYRDKVLGAFFTLDSVKLEEDGRTSAPLTASQTSIGAYGGWRSGALSVNGSASYGFVDFDDKRDIAFSTLTDKVVAKWKGNTIQAAGRANYDIPLGFLHVKPYVAADYMGLNQQGYTETATTLSSLALVTGDASSHLATASAGLALAAHFDSGSAFKIDPEITVGYKSVLSFDSSPATARYLNQTTSFKLGRGSEPDSALLAGFGLNVSSQYLNIKVGYDAEISDTAVTHYGSITLRLAFW